jgi:hypothetical protein
MRFGAEHQQVDGGDLASRLDGGGDLRVQPPGS